MAAWPSLPDYADWRATCDTLHAHTQVLGKLAVALAPPEPQLQHAALRLTARGWETGPLPAPFRAAYRGGRTAVNGGWGSVGLAVNLFSGGSGEPASEDFIMANAMDSQEVAVGWWPGNGRYGHAAFYAYAHPAPDGFAGA